MAETFVRSEPDLEWMDRAACRRVDAGMFFSATAESARTAMAAHLCVTHCPELARCDDFRLRAERNRHGQHRDVWRSCVIAGWRYGEYGAPKRAVASSRGCPICVGLS